MSDKRISDKTKAYDWHIIERELDSIYGDTISEADREKQEAETRDQDETRLRHRRRSRRTDRVRKPYDSARIHCTLRSFRQSRFENRICTGSSFLSRFTKKAPIKIGRCRIKRMPVYRKR